jgi:SprT protein
LAFSWRQGWKRVSSSPISQRGFWNGHFGLILGLMNELLACVERCYELAEERLGRSFARPAVALDLRGQRAGVAYLNRNLLRFNAQMYSEHGEEFLRETVPHEVAHLLAHALHGSRIRPHGAEWQRLMTGLFGLPAKRCHDYPVVHARRRTSYLYKCACPVPVPFTAQRHAWVGKGRRYQCLRCGTLLHFTGHRRVA